MKMKKIYWCAVFAVYCLSSLQAQQNPYSAYYYQRASLYERLPIDSTDIVFLGNSITDGGEWAELFRNCHVKNRGISGDRTTGIYERLNTILPGKPKKIFLMIGVNDLQHGASADSVINGILRIANRIAKDSPKTMLYIQSILPVNNQFGKFPMHTNKGAAIVEINNRIKLFCGNENLVFIDLYTAFKNEGDEKLNPQYTNDGLHLMGAGYLLWVKLVSKYIY